MKSILYIPILVALLLIPTFPKGFNPNDAPPVVTHKYKQQGDAYQWADSTLATLSLEQKVGQLFMAACFGKSDAAQDIEMQNLINNYHIGGLIFMKGEPSTQVMLVNQYQNYARIPLMVAQDAEWGVNMRLPSAVRFPRNLTLGAIQDDSLLYKFGVEMGRQCKTVGVQINFAPVVDVNNNPRNPVIADRSFGENKYNVVRKAQMVTQGLTDQRVLACAKHFPGHGDTDQDSHKELPMIPYPKERLDTLELYPFYRMIEYGMPSVMVAHLSVPALDATPHLPSSLSAKVVKGLLREKMNFNGLIFTDALNMEGVAKYYPTGDAEITALKAGNDVMLYSKDIATAHSKIKNAVLNKTLAIEIVEDAVRRILIAKHNMGLYKRPYTPTGYTLESLNSPSAKLLKKQLYEAAVTLVKNTDQILPLGSLESMNIAYIQIGGTKDNTFTRTLQKYAGIKTFNLPANLTTVQVETTLSQLRNYNTVILGVFDMNKRATENYGVANATAELSRRVALLPNTQSITCLMGSPYALRSFGTEKALLVGYEDEPEVQQAIASAIFGGLVVNGVLPVTASPQFKEGRGEVIPTVTRFGFALPEEMGMKSYVLNKIDSIAKRAVQERLVPGFAVAVMRGDKILYDKGFGKTDYSTSADSIDAILHTYDLASVTKIMATTTIAMQLYEQGQLDLNRTVGEYVPEFKNTNKAYLTVRELLQHTAGLKAWIPFYLDTYTDATRNRLRKDLYATQYSDSYNIQVAPNLFLRHDYRDSIWQKILMSEVGSRERLVYSDLSMILLGRIIESVTGGSLEDYACTNFYKGLGMSSTCFNPAAKGLGENCPPTEIDDEWRKCVVKGYVHDPASAIMGGVAGNAGLFANVYDVCKLMYMLKNGGEYGRRIYLESETIKKFATKQVSFSRRGLGFDKPNSDPERSGQVSGYASDEAFGHLGFTGNSVWIDPKYDLIFVFLSNRTYPNSHSKAFNRRHVRKEVMDLVYESMIRKKTS